MCVVCMTKRPHRVVTHQTQEHQFRTRKHIHWFASKVLDVREEDEELDIGIATCHTVSYLDSGERVGNAVECEMLRFSKMDMRMRGDIVEYCPKEDFSGKEESFAPGAGGAEDSTDCEEAEDDDSKDSDAEEEDLPCSFRTVRAFEFCQTRQLQSVIVDVISSSKAPAPTSANASHRRHLFVKVSIGIRKNAAGEKCAL